MVTLHNNAPGERLHNGRPSAMLNVRSNYKKNNDNGRRIINNDTNKITKR